MTIRDLFKWLWGERVSLSLGQFGCLLLLFGFIILCGVLTPGAVPPLVPGVSGWVNAQTGGVVAKAVTHPAWIPYAMMAVGGLVLGVLITVAVLAEVFNRMLEQAMRNM